MTRPAWQSIRARSRQARLVLIGALSVAAWPTLAAMQPGGGAAGGAEMQGSHVVSWGKVEVAAALKLAFAVLTDYDRLAKFMPGMLTSKVVSRDAGTVVVEQTADEGFLFYKQRVTVRLAIEEFPPQRLNLRSLGGSFKELTGSYVLTRRQDRTLIEYNARFIPDFELPPMVGMMAVQHTVERHLDGLAAEILRRAAQEEGASAGSGPHRKPLPASAPDRPTPASPEPTAPGRGE